MFDRYGQRHHDYPAVPNTTTRAERDRVYRERIERVANAIVAGFVFLALVGGTFGYVLFLWSLRR